VPLGETESNHGKILMETIYGYLHVDKTAKQSGTYNPSEPRGVARGSFSASAVDFMKFPTDYLKFIKFIIHRI
jgi:hypothetical protein